MVVLGRGPGPNGFAYDVADGLWAHQVAGYSAEGFMSQLLVPGPDLLLMVGGEVPNASPSVRKTRALRLARDEDDGDNFEFEMVMYQEARGRRKFLFYNEKCWAFCRLEVKVARFYFIGCSFQDFVPSPGVIYANGVTHWNPGT